MEEMPHTILNPMNAAYVTCTIKTPNIKTNTLELHVPFGYGLFHLWDNAPPPSPLILLASLITLMQM